MAKETAKQSSDVTLLLMLSDMLTVIVHTAGRKPSDPDVLAALGRLDNQRQELQRQLGQDATELHTPHGPLSTYAPPAEEDE